MVEGFRLGLVGAGMITGNAHLPAALASSNIIVTAIVDPEIDRAKRLAADFGIKPVIASDVSDVLGYMDGAVIATPNGTHKDLAIQCLEENVSVLVEKPLARTFQEGQEIVRAAKRSEGILAVGCVTRFRPNIRQLAQLLNRDYFGAITRFYHQFGTAGGWAPFSAYNLDRANVGGGVLVVSATHFLDRMLHFWGYPKETGYRDDGHDGIEGNCEVSFTFERGDSLLRGRARYSKTAYLPAGMVIECEAGIVRLDDTDEADIILRPGDASDIEHRVNLLGFGESKNVNTFELQLDDFLTAAQNNQKPMVDGEQGLLSLRLIDELYSKRQLTDTDWYGSDNEVEDAE